MTQNETLNKLAVLLFVLKHCSCKVPKTSCVVREELDQSHVAWPLETLSKLSNSKAGEIEDCAMKHLVSDASES